MPDNKDVDLFSMLGSHVKLRNTKDAHEEKLKDKSDDEDLFVDEEIQNPETQLHPRVMGWLNQNPIHNKTFSFPARHPP